MSRFTTRDLAYVGVFGAVWGAVEVSLGSYLHLVRAPFRGMVLVAMAVCIFSAGRRYVPRRGATILMALTAAGLKTVSAGGVILNPVIAILMEGLLGEAGFSMLGNGRKGAALAGALASSWLVLHRFLTLGIIGGWGLSNTYNIVVSTASSVLPIHPDRVGLLMAAWLVLHVVVGAVSGLAGHEVGRRIEAFRQPAQHGAGGREQRGSSW